MAIRISNLVLEVTRRCNMVCAHCLRGKAQGLDMPNEVMDSLLDQCGEYLSNVTFSGGEPTIAVDRIRYFFEQVKERQISLGSFFIRTNAKKIPTDFVLLCLEMYAYCDEKEMCQVEASQDDFHEGTAHCGQDLDIVRGLSFFQPQEVRHGYGQHQVFINEGYYAENFGDGRELTVHPFEPYYSYGDIYLDNTEVYINCKGEVVSCCDLSYTRQSEEALCHIDKLSETLERMIEDEEDDDPEACLGGDVNAELQGELV